MVRNTFIPLKGLLISSNLSNYGTKLMQGPLEQSKVYEKQEKQFNIINCYPKSYTPKLKQFPRFTLEAQLMEKKG